MAKKNKIFSNSSDYESKYYSQKAMRANAKRKALGKLYEIQSELRGRIKEAQELKVLERTNFAGVDIDELSLERWKKDDVTTKEINAETKRLRGMLMNKKRTDPQWISRHLGTAAHEQIQFLLDNNPDKERPVDIYDVFDWVDETEGFMDRFPNYVA